MSLEAVATIEQVDVSGIGIEQRQCLVDSSRQEVIERRCRGDRSRQHGEAFKLAHAAPGGLVEARIHNRRGNQRSRMDHEGGVLFRKDAWRLGVEGDHANHFVVGGDQWNRHDRLVLLLFELGEVLDARILKRIFGDKDGLAVFGDPASQTLPATHRDGANLIAIALVGDRSQHQCVVGALSNEDQRRMGTRLLGHKFDDGA